MNAETNILIALLGEVPMASHVLRNVSFSSERSFDEIGTIVAVVMRVPFIVVYFVGCSVPYTLDARKSAWTAMRQNCDAGVLN